VFLDSRILDNSTRLHSAPWACSGAQGGAGGTIVAIAQFGPRRSLRKHVVYAVPTLEGHLRCRYPSTRRGILGDEPTFASITLTVDLCNLQEQTNR
jgi:hypothetical protein